MTTSRTPIERDARVLQLYEQLIEIEPRLVPTGLHVFGRAAELQEKADLLRMVASFDRPEHGARSLPALVAEGLGVHSYEQLLRETPSSEMKELIDKIVQESVELFCVIGNDAAAKLLNEKAGVDHEKSASTF